MFPLIASASPLPVRIGVARACKINTSYINRVSSVTYLSLDDDLKRSAQTGSLLELESLRDTVLDPYAENLERGMTIR